MLDLLTYQEACKTLHNYLPKRMYRTMKVIHSNIMTDLMTEAKWSFKTKSKHFLYKNYHLREKHY